MLDDYKPRFSFEISEEQKTRVDRLLSTYGLRKSVFSVILDDLLDLIEEHGQIVVGVLLDRAAKPREIMPSLAEAERKAK
jgi:hypothetical protein